LWTIPRIENGDQASLVLVATVISGAASINRAQVASSRQFDPDSIPGNMIDTEDDMASVSITPNVVDISVNANVNNDAPLEGETIAITLTAANTGTIEATGVVIRSVIPSGLTLVSANPDQGSYDPATGLWTVGTLAAGADAELVLDTVVDVRGVKQLPVEVIATDQFDVDSTPNNNIATEDDQTTLAIRAPRLLNKRLFLAR
jgi:large repetitive protein